MPFLSAIKGCFGISPANSQPPQENLRTSTQAEDIHRLFDAARRHFSTCEGRNPLARTTASSNISTLSIQAGNPPRPLHQLSVEAAILKSNSGMLAQHLHAVLQIASETNTVIGFRPVSWAAKSYIQAGYPSKNFHIKTKSAKWGPQLGLLCPSTTETLDEAHAKKGSLFLSSGRIHELLEKGCIRLERVKQNADNAKTGFETANHFIFYADEPAHETTSSSGTNTQGVTTHQYQAVKRESPSNPMQTDAPHGVIWDIKKFPSGLNTETETANENVEVLFCPTKNLPITADYDLLSYARPTGHKNDENNQTRLDVKDIDALGRTLRLLKGQPRSTVSLSGIPDAAVPSPIKSSHSASMNTVSATEDPDRGNVSPFTNHLIDSINQALARGEGLDMVHHNTEAGNPFASEASCYPAIFCLPGERPEALSSTKSLTTLSDMNRPLRSAEEDTHRWNGDRVVLVKTPAEMTHLKKVLKEHGYHLEVSPTFIGGGETGEGISSERPRLRPSQSGML